MSSVVSVNYAVLGGLLARITSCRCFLLPPWVQTFYSASCAKTMISGCPNLAATA